MYPDPIKPLDIALKLSSFGFRNEDDIFEWNATQVVKRIILAR